MLLIANICRILGRVLGVTLAAIVAMFWLGEGGPNLAKASPLERVHYACFVLVPVALLAGWRWELIGGIVSVLATAAFFGIDHLRYGGWPGGPIFTTMWIPGALLIASGLLRRRIVRTQAASMIPRSTELN